MSTTSPAESTAKGTAVSLASLPTDRKHSRAPSTEAMAKDHTIRYIRSRLSSMMAGPGWMP